MVLAHIILWGASKPASGCLLMVSLLSIVLHEVTAAAFLSDPNQIHEITTSFQSFLKLVRPLWK